MTQSGINTVDSILSNAIKEGVVHLTTQNEIIDDMLIRIDGKDLVNFGSCSYLGLEFNQKMKDSAQDAIQRYGTQFSSSRAYVSIGLYEEFESKLALIFGAPTIVAPSTTLAHLATIPVVVEDNDAVILDHQVHNTVQTAVGLLKGRRIHVEMMRHNRMDILEQKINELKGKYNRIWYMADGIYSMYGDFSPVDKVRELLEKYPMLHYYVDDAHGMSCYGDKGQGSVLSHGQIHSRMIVTTSFAKAFATGGGAIIFPNEDIAMKVRNCGGPFNSSGPMQPASLGAAIAAADLHLSGEICKEQKKLLHNVRYTKYLLEQYGLPDVSANDSPIFFVGVSLPKVAYNLIRRLMESGHYLNLGIFPTVPIKNTGVRFTITSVHSFEQIEKMVGDMAYHYHLAMAEENFSIEKVYEAFKITPPTEVNTTVQDLSQNALLTVELKQKIKDVNQSEWDKTVGQEGAFDSSALDLLENAFCNNELPEDNWAFNYITIKDRFGKIVLNTFTTSGIVKDDMLADKDISVDMEKCRLEEPYFCTSKFLSVGTLITEGDHIFIDRQHPLWREALNSFFRIMDELQKLNDASTLMIRDLDSDDSEIEDQMIQNGYVKFDMPLKYSLNISHWNTPEEFYQQLSKRSKRHFKEDVLKFQDEFEVTFVTEKTENADEYFSLYKQVYDKSFEINTHILPRKFFDKIIAHPNWEIVELKLKKLNKIVGVVFVYKNGDAYIGNLVGMDYSFNREYNVYRQAIYQMILRAKSLGKNVINFGFSAGIEKKKFGAVGSQTVNYVQLKDNFTVESLISEAFAEL